MTMSIHISGGGGKEDHQQPGEPGMKSSVFQLLAAPTDHSGTLLHSGRSH